MGLGFEFLILVSILGFGSSLWVYDFGFWTFILGFDCCFLILFGSFLIPSIQHQSTLIHLIATIIIFVVTTTTPTQAK